MPAIHFKTTLLKINSTTILLLPKNASAKLPSRGQTMVEGTINDYRFQAPLEPDGRRSHWLKINEAEQKAIGAGVGDLVNVAIEPAKEWPEPDVPSDLQSALAHHTQANRLWADITTMARWEWIRWIRSTNKQETRKHRIEVACSKLAKGERRPCCWNYLLCTEPRVSKAGVLLGPTQG